MKRKLTYFFVIRDEKGCIAYFNSSVKVTDLFTNILREMFKKMIVFLIVIDFK